MSRGICGWVKEHRNCPVGDKIAVVVMASFFLIATLFIDLICTGTNFLYRWKLTPALRENTNALTKPITEHPTQIVLGYLEASDLDNFLLDPQTLGVAELKGRIEQTGVITAQQFERLEFLNAHCEPNQKIGIDLQKVTHASVPQSDITDERFGALLKQFPNIDSLHIENCTKLTQAGIQKAIIETPRQWKNLSMMSSFRYPIRINGMPNHLLATAEEYGNALNIEPAFLDALKSHVSSLESLSIKYWFPPRDPFDRLLQNCRQLKSFSADGRFDDEDPNAPTIAALASCLSLEKLHVRHFGNQSDALHRIFENCPLTHVSLALTNLSAGSLSLLAENRQNDLRTLHIYSRGYTENDLRALARHCHGLQLLAIPYDPRVPKEVYTDWIADNRQLEAFAFSINNTPQNDPAVPDFAALAKARPNLKHFYSAVSSETAVEDMRTMIRLLPELKSIWIRIDWEHMPGEERYQGAMRCKKQLKEEFPNIIFSRFYVENWQPAVSSNDEW